LENNGLLEFLKQYVSERRFRRFTEVVMHRTRYLTVVLEDIFQPHNASAVLRTCDCLGIQDVYIVENRNNFSPNPDVALGADKWLTLTHYRDPDGDNTRRALYELKQKGYRLVATSPHRKSNSPENFDLEKGKAALLFGTELTGLSETALSMADEFLQVPMVGFTESFNISVTAAVVLYTLANRLRNSSISWQLTDDEQKQLLLEWMRNSVRNPEALERWFHETRGKDEVHF
jgi:tRNA (guanosine-2'-O-)-methyltransferase